MVTHFLPEIRCWLHLVIQLMTWGQPDGVHVEMSLRRTLILKQILKPFRIWMCAIGYFAQWPGDNPGGGYDRPNKSNNLAMFLNMKRCIYPLKKIGSLVSAFALLFWYRTQHVNLRPSCRLHRRLNLPDKCSDGRCVFFFVSWPAAALDHRSNVEISAPLSLTQLTRLMSGFDSLICYLYRGPLLFVPGCLCAAQRHLLQMIQTLVFLLPLMKKWHLTHFHPSEVKTTLICFVGDSFDVATQRKKKCDALRDSPSFIHH